MGRKHAYLRYKAITAVDTRVQVPRARRMKVQTSILYAGFDQTELRRKLSTKGKTVQINSNSIANTTRVYFKGRNFIAWLNSTI